MNQDISRRDFLLMATGLIGEVMLWPLVAKAHLLIPQNENPNFSLENWLLNTGKTDFEPTISSLLNGNTTSVHLP